MRSPSPTPTATASGTCAASSTHLDHIASLGVDTRVVQPVLRLALRPTPATTWRTISPSRRRYGTNDDMVELVARARERGIRVLLDLVGRAHVHRAPWFRPSWPPTGRPGGRPLHLGRRPAGPG
ncbi:alpha-amylase family glycosyl hydrolase [Actinoplanes nipponensis]|uniref:alpha-amylase family glycosyl hydrolase n=1 Tax=Actinoplanes nipponensis TaxID=135950 RepID=UPI0034DAE228